MLEGRGAMLAGMSLDRICRALCGVLVLLVLSSCVTAKLWDSGESSAVGLTEASCRRGESGLPLALKIVLTPFALAVDLLAAPLWIGTEGDPFEDWEPPGAAFQN